MSTSESGAGSCSNTSEESEYVYESQYRPYEGEPLASDEEDLTTINSVCEAEEIDLDGLTAAILEARFDRKVTLDSW